MWRTTSCDAVLSSSPRPWNNCIVTDFNQKNQEVCWLQRTTIRRENWRAGRWCYVVIAQRCILYHCVVQCVLTTFGNLASHFACHRKALVCNTEVSQTPPVLNTKRAVRTFKLWNHVPIGLAFTLSSETRRYMALIVFPFCAFQDFSSHSQGI